MSEQYRVKIDKSKLKEFFTTPLSSVTKEQKQEVEKVITAVLIHHYQKYYYQFRELRSLALLYVCERHDRFNPSMDAYNYMYTAIRNCIGNHVGRKSSKMEDFCDILPDRPIDFSEEQEEALNKYRKFLASEEHFTFVKVDKADVLDLLSAITSVLFNKDSDTQRLTRINNMLIKSIYGRK